MVVPPFIIAGIGMGLFFAPIANVVLSAVRPEEEGKASGANNTIREVGGVFGVAILASVFSANGGTRAREAFVDGMVPAVWWAPPPSRSPPSPPWRSVRAPAAPRSEAVGQVAGTD